MCVEGVALDMIPVLDNFRAAGAHVPEEEKAKAWMTGITYIGKQLEDAKLNSDFYGLFLRLLDQDKLLLNHREYPLKFSFAQR